eukprot:COSAG05_NODE_2255_length_3333_cov_2.791899_1_plen_199_part_00
MFHIHLVRLALLRLTLLRRGMNVGLTPSRGEKVYINSPAPTPPTIFNKFLDVSTTRSLMQTLHYRHTDTHTYTHRFVTLVRLVSQSDCRTQRLKTMRHHSTSDSPRPPLYIVFTCCAVTTTSSTANSSTDPRQNAPGAAASVPAKIAVAEEVSGDCHARMNVSERLTKQQHRQSWVASISEGRHTSSAAPSLESLPSK